MSEGSTDWVHSVAERKIQEAIDEGLFENLPGKGKPLRLDDDALTPAHLRIVHHILKNANVVPEWVLWERQIEDAKLEAQRFFDHCVALGHSLDPVVARAEYLRLMKAANDLILKFNVVNPFVHRAPVPFRIRQQLAEWDERFSEVRSAGAGGDAT